jgi:hypothetical protein
MTLTVPPWAAGEAASLPYPLVFATVSGAHLYGFASVDSDLDLRAAHVLPVAEVVGLRTGPETVQHMGVRDGIELDVVSHDLLGAGLPYVPELIAAKREAEHGPLPPAARAALDRDVPRLRADLESARDSSVLPLSAPPEAVDALHDLIVQARLS